jgi:hypothetical protein
MAEWSANNSAERTSQVWERMLGCFGDSLIRKFGEEPPPEWDSAIASLNDYQLRQGMRRLMYSGKGHAPTLPEFVKLCRTVGHTDDVPDAPSAPALPALTNESAWDRWALAGNRRLLGYVTRKIPPSPRCYGHRDSPEFRAAIGTLAAMKNRWVELMQESATAAGVPPDDQNQSWRECMRQAEELIAAKKAA